MIRRAVSVFEDSGLLGCYCSFINPHCFIPQDTHRQQYRCENLIFRNSVFLTVRGLSSVGKEILLLALFTQAVNDVINFELIYTHLR